MHILQSSFISQVDGVRHGFFYPGTNGNNPDTGNNFSFKNGRMEEVLQARKSACGLIGIDPAHLTHVYQVHGTKVWKAEPHHRGAGAEDGTSQSGEGDAMITNVPGEPLAILIADCLPVYFADQQGSAVGIAHAGWRGSLGNIVSQTIQHMQHAFRTDPADLQVWIGPGISHHHFEIGKDVWDQFQETWSQYDDIFYERTARYLDLKRLNFYQLVSAGVLPDNVEISTHCTYQNLEMFSYRRDGAGVGHNLAVIGL